MKKQRLFFYFSLVTLTTLSTVHLLGCSGGSKSDSGGSTSSGSSYSISGAATYDYVPALDNVTEGGVRLNYSAKTAKPIRRAVVQAISGSTVIASSSTDDLGNFTITGITEGTSVNIRVLAKSTQTSYTPDSTAPNYCNGAAWDIRVVDNATNNSASETDPSLRSQYAVTTSSTYSTATTGVTLSAGLTYSSGYTLRAAAPFAILDSLVTQMELVCQSEANTSFAKLYVNWSSDNTNAGGNKYQGQVGTSHYTTEDYTSESSVGNLYILGKENTDTDEYDDHVIAHEFGHYLESKLYRSDSIGDSHSMGDSLDPRVAFGEGYGNALSAMTFNDAVYVDTSGSNQASGFVINMATAPTGDDKAIYSERAVQNFLWQLYDARDATANSGSYDRIHNIMRNYQRTTPALTNIMSFGAYYVQQYSKSGDGFNTLFAAAFDVPVDALCSGTCPASGGTADLYDSDYDLASAYGASGSAPKNYKQGTSTTFNANFWRQYFTLTSGANSDSDHMQVHAGGYTSSYGNKYGLRRWYKYVVPSNTTSLKFVATSSNCATDTLDIQVFRNGTPVAADYQTTGATAGCPDSSTAAGTTLTATAGETLIVVVTGKSTTTTGYTMTVTP